MPNEPPQTREDMYHAGNHTNNCLSFKESPLFYYSSLFDMHHLKRSSGEQPGSGLTGLEASTYDS